MKTQRARTLLVTLALTAAWISYGFFSSPGARGAPSPNATAMADMNRTIPMSRTMPINYTMSMSEEDAPASPVSGRDWSVFNHHGAGWFVFFWGLTALIAGLQPRRTWLRFVPPLMLLGLVEFLFLRNDPKAWPIGPYGFWISFKDPAVLQHRVFILLILAIAVIELLRAADRLPAVLRQFALPSLAAFGGVYLFFHKHGGLAMQQMMQHLSDPAMAHSPAIQRVIASMDWIKHEHLWFSITGFGLAAAKLSGDSGLLRGRLGATLWTVFAIALGIYMLGYTE